jgi:hypothetical protein
MDECIPCPAGTAVNLATAGYAGPENCVNCQPGSFRIEWKTRLATAYECLIRIKNRKNSIMDLEDVQLFSIGRI